MRLEVPEVEMVHEVKLHAEMAREPEPDEIETQELTFEMAQPT
jgi:hypothetical protein